MKYRVFITEKIGRYQNAIKMERRSHYIGNYQTIISYDKDSFDKYESVGYDRSVKLLKNKEEVIKKINKFVDSISRLDDEYKISTSIIAMFKYNLKLLDEFENVESNFTHYKIDNNDYKINKRTYNKELKCIDLYVNLIKEVGVKSDVEMDNMMDNAYKEWIESRSDYSKRNKDDIIYFKNDRKSIIKRIKNFIN